ncbi:MAG TPA: cobalt-precorrin-5B (C(1))-methyltransferase [Methanomassiliicoccales archaeon]|jgi:cobalt-precorrin-5B (C1)-methyltransferase
MKDPVTGFEYPAKWSELIRDKAWSKLVEQGLAVLNSKGEVLRRGFSTGTTAAAACKGAVLSLDGPVETVTITLPSGIRIDVPVVGNEGAASCLKFAGDYLDDPTARAEFVAEAFSEGEGVHLLPCEGIGEYALPEGSKVAGSPAISASALGSIVLAISQAKEEIGIRGVRVELHVVDGEKIAIRTVNPRFGIDGGISVLGTTGLVDPWDDHIEEGRFDKLTADKVVLTTGKMGLRMSRLFFPDHEVIMVGRMMLEAVKGAQNEVVVCGLPGNIIRAVVPHVLEEYDRSSFDDLAASDRWKEVLDRVFQLYRAVNPKVRILLLDRSGKALGELL